MARTDTLGNFLTDVATAIRNKKGTTDTIVASKFDTEIESIESGGGDISEYFGDTLRTGNSSTSGVNMIIKKIPTPIALPTDCSYLFARCESLQEIPLLDTSQVTNMANMFLSCKSITTIPSLDTSNCTDMNNMFSDCNSLQEIPLLDTSKVTNMYNMFGDCSNIESIPSLDTSQVTNMKNMFIRAKKLKTIPQFNTSKVTAMDMMFYANGALEEIPSLNTGSVTTMYNMFGYQSKLHTVGLLDCSSITNIYNIFNGCSSLTNLDGLKDLGKAYSTSKASDYYEYELTLSYCSNLTHDSLMNVINNLYDIKSAGCNIQRLNLGSANKAKLTEEEIAIATNKGWNVV